MAALCSRNLRTFMFALVAVFTLCVLPSISMAASTAVFGSNLGAPPALTGALDTLLWWIYLIFKIIAVVVVGWSMLEIRSGELTKGFFGVLAAVGLFFTPALVELARTLGGAASGAVVTP